jgi:hypothetical protein
LAEGPNALRPVCNGSGLGRRPGNAEYARTAPRNW